MRNLIKYFGMLGALAALLATHSTHWAALQTVAWSRMLVAFAQEGSLISAIGRTFNGQNPCKLCLKVREGIAADHHANSVPSAPAPNGQQTGAALWEFRIALIPAPALFASEEHASFTVFVPEFRYAPPGPPPRS